MKHDRIQQTTMTIAALALLAASTFGCSSKQPASTQMTDAAITSKVKAKLAADPEINPFEIDVDTDNRIVRLSGTVETAEDRAHAGEIAAGTEGVMKVNNEIALGDPTLSENITDGWIETKVKAKFVADPELNPFNIDVDVVRGIVTLSGIVESDGDREEASKLAKNTRGVKEVRNQLKVKS